MGIGDAIMSVGEARELSRRTGQKVLIVGRDGLPVKSDMFEGVPYLIPQPIEEPHHRMVNGTGVRPYFSEQTPTKWTWRKYKPIPAEIYFTDRELAFAEPYRGMVMVEPNVKAIGHRNKDWGWNKWQQLDDTIYLEQITRLVQCGPPDTRFLSHVTSVITPSFRLAAAVLSNCRAYVGTEGGLMHVAAAVGTPAVIIWSEFVSPDITGYDCMCNIRKAGPPCGSRVECESCRWSLDAISPTEVVQALKDILNRNPHLER